MKSLPRPSQESEESFPESEEGLLSNKRSPCRECQSRRRKQHYSILLPWILCIFLTIALAVAALRGASGRTSEIWDTTEFGMFDNPSVRHPTNHTQRAQRKRLILIASKSDLLQVSSSTRTTKSIALQALQNMSESLQTRWMPPGSIWLVVSTFS